MKRRKTLPPNLHIDMRQDFLACAWNVPLKSKVLKVLLKHLQKLLKMVEGHKNYGLIMGQNSITNYLKND